jgi:hypothetical protein
MLTCLIRDSDEYARIALKNVCVVVGVVDIWVRGASQIRSGWRQANPTPRNLQDKANPKTA